MSVQVDVQPARAPGRGPGAVLTKSEAVRLVTGLCEQAAVACADAACPQTPARNAVVVLPAAGLVARVSSPERLPHMRRELLVAAWLAERGIPVGEPAPAPPYPQAALFEGMAVTWWRYLPGAVKADAPAVCAVLSHIHRLRPALDLLGPFDPFPTMRGEIEAATGMSEADREVMRAVADTLAERWRESHWPGDRPVVLHGDAHGANILQTALGIRVIDLEDATLGPWQWDLATFLAGRELGWIEDGELEAAIAAYGRDPREAREIELLVQIRLLRMSTLVAAVTARSAHLAEQVRMRVASVLDPGLRSGWWWGDWDG